jgi:hypothetical protein
VTPARRSQQAHRAHAARENRDECVVLQGETFGRISGPAEGKPLVRLPAGHSSSKCGIPIVGDLARDFRVYAVDAIYN